MADALASGASVRKDVGVQVPPRALLMFTVVCCTGQRVRRRSRRPQPLARILVSRGEGPE